MVVKVFFKKREDGTDTYRWYDAKTKDGKIVCDEDGVPVPSGYMIRVLGTKKYLKEVVGVESKVCRYVGTKIRINPRAVANGAAEKEAE